MFSEHTHIFIMDSPSEPTQVLSMMGAFQTKIRHSTSGTRLSMSNTHGQFDCGVNIQFKANLYILLCGEVRLLSDLLTRVIVFQAIR